MGCRRIIIGVHLDANPPACHAKALQLISDRIHRMALGRLHICIRIPDNVVIIKEGRNPTAIEVNAANDADRVLMGE